MVPAPQPDGDAPADAGRTVAQVVRALAQAAQALPAADQRASRVAAQLTIDLALRRTLLLLTPAAREVANQLREIRAQVARLLGDAEAFAQTTGPVHWSRPALEAATAMLRGQEPPFRLDLTAARAPPAPRRRRHQRGNPDGVDPIETTDPEEDETDSPQGRPSRD